MHDAPNEARIDAALVARALTGHDQAAFGQLVRRHQGVVRAQLRRLAQGDHAWADDLAQETFFKAWRSLHQFRGEARFSTWLHRIAYNIFLQETRSRKSRGTAMTRVGSASPTDSRGPALGLDVLAALGRLPEGEQLSVRSEERRVGKECPSKCRSRWSPYH